MSRLSTLLVCAAILGCSLGVLPGCGDDEGPGGVGGCPNCEYWTKLTDRGGQFPAVHPSRSGVIAYSSRDGDDAEDADIWIREEVADSAVYHRITNDPGEERLPSWSPDGRRLAFSRFTEGRYDLWIVDVSAFDTPTDLQKVTTADLIEGDPARSAWQDDQTLIFTDGEDIFQLSLAAGRSASLVELVPDPADQILGLGVKFQENQPAFVRTPSGSELLAFISDSRGPQGNIAVSAFAETGEQITASISIDQKPLLNPDRDTLRTPFNVFGIAPGTYRVGVTTTGGQNGLCDTTLAMDVSVSANQVKDAEFIVTRPRGALRVLAARNLSSRIILVYSNGVDVDFGTVLSDTTEIGCLIEGVYEVRLLGTGVPKDSTSILVQERKVSQVCLTAALDGCPDSLDIVGVDTLIYVPPDEGGTFRPDDAKAFGEFRAGQAPPSLQSPAADETDLWFYDIEADTLRALTMDRVAQGYPAWSADGQYLAYIQEGMEGRWTLELVNLDGFATRSVPLPGRRSTTICNRTVAQPGWAPSGRQIVVSLTNCDDEIETRERADLWIVDVSTFLP